MHTSSRLFYGLSTLLKCARGYCAHDITYTYTRHTFYIDRSPPNAIAVDSRPG